MTAVIAIVQKNYLFSHVEQIIVDIIFFLAGMWFFLLTLPVFSKADSARKREQLPRSVSLPYLRRQIFSVFFLSSSSFYVRLLSTTARGDLLMSSYITDFVLQKFVPSLQPDDISNNLFIIWPDICRPWYSSFEFVSGRRRSGTRLTRAPVPNFCPPVPDLNADFKKIISTIIIFFKKAHYMVPASIQGYLSIFLNWKIINFYR